MHQPPTTFLSKENITFYHKESTFPSFSYAGYLSTDNYSYLILIYYQSLGTEEGELSSELIQPGAIEISDSFFVK